MSTYYARVNRWTGSHNVMEANSRKTIRVNDVPGMQDTDASTYVQGTQPIIAERAMYWNERGAGTDTIGGFSD